MPIQSHSEFVDGISDSVCSRMESARSTRALRRQNAISQKTLQEKFLIEAEGDGAFDCMFCNESYKHHEQLGKHVLARHKPTLCEPTVLCVDAEYLGPKDKRRRSAGESTKENKDDHEGSDCEVCGQTFIDSTDLESHMKKHKDSFTYSCNICGRRFKEPWFLKNHKRTHSGRTGWRNKQAALETPVTINEMVQEQADSNVTSAYKLCMVCGFIFPNKEALLDHSKIHVKETGTNKESVTSEEPENISKENFLNFLQLKPTKPQAEKPETSRKWIGELDPFNTYQAWQLATKGKVALGFGCVKEPLLEVNLEIDSDKDEITDTWNTDKMSQSIHSDETDTVKDDDCAGAAQAQDLDEPEKPNPEEETKVGSELEKAPCCPDCGRLFKTYHQLVLHARVHKKDRSDSESSTTGSIGGLRPTDSPDAPARVEDQVAVKMKEESETEDAGGDDLTSERRDERAILRSRGLPSSRECSFCGKSFRSNYYLNIHLRTHTGEKPYKCDFCDYAAAQKTSLRYHLERHHKFKPGESNARVRIISKSLQLLKTSPDFPANVQESKMSQNPITDAKKEALLSKPPKRMSALRSKMLNAKRLYPGEQMSAVKREPEEEPLKTDITTESSLPRQIKLDPDMCSIKVETSEESEVFSPYDTKDLEPVPLDLSMNSAKDVSATLYNRALLVAVHFCPYCAYRTLYPEVLTIHHNLLHKQNSDLPKNSSKSKNSGLPIKAKRTGCPPALQGMDVFPVQLYPTRTRVSPPLAHKRAKWARAKKAAASGTDCKCVEQQSKLKSGQLSGGNGYLQPNLQGMDESMQVYPGNLRERPSPSFKDKQPRRTLTPSNKVAASETDCKCAEQENKLQSDQQQVGSSRYLQPDLQGTDESSQQLYPARIMVAPSFRDEQPARASAWSNRPDLQSIAHLLERMQHPDQKRPSWIPKHQLISDGANVLGSPSAMPPSGPSHLRPGELRKRNTPAIPVSASGINYTNAEVMRRLHQSPATAHSLERPGPSPLSSNMSYPYEVNPRRSLKSYEQPPSGALSVCNPSQNPGSTASMEGKPNTLYPHISNRGYGPNEKRP